MSTKRKIMIILGMIFLDQRGTVVKVRTCWSAAVWLRLAMYPDVSFVAVKAMMAVHSISSAWIGQRANL